MSSHTGERSAIILAVFLAGAGILHFARPEMYDQIVPTSLPMSNRFWTLSSGFAEIGVAALVALQSTRAIGGLAAAALFVAVFPANISMAVDSSNGPAGEFAFALARLPLQIPLIWWGYRVYKRASGRGKERNPVKMSA